MSTDTIGTIGRAESPNVLAHMLAESLAKEAKDAGSPYQLRFLGDPNLSARCAPVSKEDGVPPGLLDVMRRVCNTGRFGLRPGVGLAANQVGSLAAVALVRLDGEQVVMINPRITATSRESHFAPEGCLSVPGFTTNVSRYRAVHVMWENEQFETQQRWIGAVEAAQGLVAVKNLEVASSPLAVGAQQFEARIIQHEIDHLNGVLITDGLTRQQRRNAERCVAKALAS